MTIPRFSLSNDKFQAADSAKYLVVSTREFELPADRPATFAVDLAVENIGGEPGDYRRGMAAFHVFDLELTQRCPPSAAPRPQQVERGLARRRPHRV